MKICFLGGTSSTHLKRWIKYFVDKGYEIYWISLEPITDEEIEEVGEIKFYLVKRLPSKAFALFNLLFNAFQIRRLISEIKPDVLHAHYAGVVGALGGLSGFHPFILTPWGRDVLILPRFKFMRPLVKFALNRADLVTCNGEPMREEINKLGVSLKKIKFVYWGTDIQKFKPASKDKKIRSSLRIFNLPMVISLRHLEPLYDVETLIRAIPLVLENFPKVKFVIAGKGYQEKKLKKLVKSLGVSDNIRFIGWIPYNELPQYLNSADIYVSTSLSDGDLSQCTQEAMACELPIITTDLKVNKERITDGENGLIVPTKDPKSLAERIILLLKNKELRIKLGKAGRRTIGDKLNYYKEMKKVEIIYKELVNKFNRQ